MNIFITAHCYQFYSPGKLSFKVRINNMAFIFPFLWEYICIILYLNKHVYMCVCLVTQYRLFATHWTVACQAFLTMGFFRLLLEWVATSSSKVSSWRNLTRVSCVSCLGRWVLHLLSHQENPRIYKINLCDQWDYSPCATHRVILKKELIQHKTGHGFLLSEVLILGFSVNFPDPP